MKSSLYTSIIICSIAIGTLFCGCTCEQDNFVRQENGKFVLNSNDYRYVGMNFWYGPILASVGAGGDRDRLIAELDRLHELGIDNLRILAGADGTGDEPFHVTPCLQYAPGVYNDTLLDGLDYLLYEMSKRDMKAVLFLNNAWDWSGGYVFYLEHAGRGKALNLNDNGYFDYIAYASRFSVDSLAQQYFYDHVKFMLSRTNAYSGVKYTDDPTIMTWQIGNEPRAFADDVKQKFAAWLKHTSSMIRTIDKNHLISVGSEGIWGCDGDEELHKQIVADPNIDYLTAHIWPVNWSWAHAETLAEDMPQVKINVTDYINKHTQLCRELCKPLVIEEFGFPRDNFSFSKAATTTQRDIYLRHIVDAFVNDDAIAGINIWSWGGNADPQHIVWQAGDPLSGDPPQEQQGLYSVFSTDTTTIEIITQTISQLK